jgi:hypothetical protein
MAAEKTRTNGDHPAATNTKRGGGIMHRLHWKPMTWSLGVFAAVTFIICVGYGLLVPKALHMTQFLEMTLPGFQWLSVGAFALGLVIDGEIQQLLEVLAKLLMEREVVDREALTQLLAAPSPA